MYRATAPGAARTSSSPASRTLPEPGSRAAWHARGHAQDGRPGILRPRHERSVAQLRLRHGDLPLLRARRLGGDPGPSRPTARLRAARSMRSRRPRSPAARSRSGSGTWPRAAQAGRPRADVPTVFTPVGSGFLHTGPRVYAALTHPLVRVAAVGSPALRVGRLGRRVGLPAHGRRVGRAAAGAVHANLVRTCRRASPAAGSPADATAGERARSAATTGLVGRSGLARARTLERALVGLS